MNRDLDVNVDVDLDVDGDRDVVLCGTFSRAS